MSSTCICRTTSIIHYRCHNPGVVLSSSAPHRALWNGTVHCSLLGALCGPVRGYCPSASHVSREAELSRPLLLLLSVPVVVVVVVVVAVVVAVAVRMSPRWCEWLLLLWSLCGCCSAAIPWCGTPINDSFAPSSPRAAIPPVALGWLHSTHFDVDACTASFEQFRASHSDWVTCYHAPVFNVHTCPRRCSRAADELHLLNATVYGSFPYAANSSICLAAIHAGVINDTTGGALLLDRFEPTTWTVSAHSLNASSSSSSSSSAPRAAPSISDWFPHGSWRAALSFGVQSRRVIVSSAAGDGGWADGSSEESVSSWTVRGRGLQARQRQLAPFSPRSGHLHAWLYPELQLRANWSAAQIGSGVNVRTSLNYSLHFVIGGHNESHYMNDVSRASRSSITTAALDRAATRWLAHCVVCVRVCWQVWLYHSLTGSRWDDVNALNRYNSRNGRWYRLADAPFTGRAYMAHHIVRWPILSSNRAPPTTANCTVLLVFGGETRYACNNRRLGVCSSEIWQLAICRLNRTMGDKWDEQDADSQSWERVDELGLTFHWRRFEWDLPQPARCDFIPIFERRQTVGLYFNLITAVGGGQLSYNDTTCQADIVTLSDLWFGLWPDYYDGGRWFPSAPLPFSPRRSAVLDDALVSTDELFGEDESPVDKSVSVAGGIRYLSHRYDPLSNRSFITAAELYADVWSCSLFFPSRNPYRMACDWHYSYPGGRADITDSPAPSGSLPVPLTSAASVLFPTGRDLLNMRIGGATSAESIERLAQLRIDNQTLPGSAVSVRLPLPPVSLLRQPAAYRSKALPRSGAVLMSDMTAARHHLPLAFLLLEDELEGVNSSFHTGTDLLLSHTLAYQQGHAKALFTTWDDGLPQRSAPSDSPSVSAPRAPVAAGGGVVGSTRPLHVDFPLRRLDHSMASTWDSAVISGGRSGGVYYNDWYTFEASVCFWPDDPSYWQQLGAMEYRGELQQLAASYRRYWRAPNQTAVGDEHMLSAADTAMFRTGVEIEAACAAGWHFHPPLAADVAVLTCAANSLWLDVELGAVRRCVRDELRCEPPLVDAGYTVCVDPLPVVDSIQVVTAVAAWRDQPVSSNAATVVSVPAAEAVEVSGELLLVVNGQWITEPVAIDVGGAMCLQPSLRNVSYHCSSSGCVDYARSVVCLLSRDIGVGELVSVSTGRGSRAVTLSSIRFSPSAEGRVPLTVSGDEPEVVSLAVADGACQFSRTSANQSSLVQCSNQRGPLRVEVCGVNFAHRSSASTGAITAFVNVTVAGEQVACDDWHVTYAAYGACNDGNKDNTLGCYKELLCGHCSVKPVMSKLELPVAVWSHWPTGALLSNSRQQADPVIRPSIQFSSCANGSYLSINTSSDTEQCLQCEPGYYSPDRGAQQCIPCWPGSFSSHRGSANCTSCTAGTHSPVTGASTCVACNLSSWQSSPGQVSCSTCDGGLYRSLPSSRPLSEPSPFPLPSPAVNSSSAVDAGATYGSCLLCPAGAECFSNGSIFAAAGFYLTITNRPLGVIGSLLCSTTSCAGPAAARTNLSLAQSVRQVEATGLTIVNYCGAHRRLDADNSMCAECVEDYSEVRGVCIYCPSPSYGWLLAVLLLAWLLVYALHRSMLQLSSSSTIPILVYFVQMSALFLPGNLFAPLNLVNLQLFSGVSPHSMCVLPVDGLGAFIGRIVSPLVVFLLLASTLALQLSLRRLLSCGCVRRPPWLKRAYRALFPSLDAASPSLFRVAPPLLDAAQPVLDQLKQPLLELSQSAADEAKVDDAAAVAAAAPPRLSVDVGDMQPHDVVGVDVAHSGVAFSGDVLSDELPVILRGYRRTLLRLLVFSYNSFATASLSFFHTRQVGEEDERRLWEYPAVSPTSDGYLALRPFMAVLVALLVAVIPLLAVLLYYFNRREQQRLTKLRTSVAEDASAVESVAPQSVLVEVMIGTFRPSHWPLAVMVLLRRLLLTAIATFVVTASYVWLTAVNTSLLVLHISTWPYRDEFDNRVEALTLTLLVLETTLLSDWLSNALISSPVTASRSALLWLLLALPFVVVLAGSVQSLYRRARDRAQRRHTHSGVLHIAASAVSLLVCGLCGRDDMEHPATIAALSAAHMAEQAGGQASILALSSP